MVDHADSGSTGGALGPRVIKQVAAWVVLGLVVLLVVSWYGTFRTKQAVWQAEQNRPKPSEAASATAAGQKQQKAPAKAPGKPAQAGSQISKVVIVSDVTLRRDPSSSSDPIRDLKKGEELILVGQVGPWYKVTDAKGAIGWVSAAERFTKIVGK